MGQEKIEWVFDDAKATIIGRGEERDQPDGERTIPRCITAFNAITGHKLSNTDGWLLMQILKMCRSVQGTYKYDDYRDGVGYAALRAEEARVEYETSTSPGELPIEPSDFAKSVARNHQLVPPECDERDGIVYDAIVDATKEAIREVCVVPSPNPPPGTDCMKDKRTQLQKDIADQAGYALCECANCTLSESYEGEVVPPECDTRKTCLHGYYECVLCVASEYS